MSHSFESSPLSGTAEKPKSPRREVGVQPACLRRESVASSHCFILCRQGDSSAMKLLFPSLFSCQKSGIGTFRLHLIRSGGCASTLGRDSFSDSVAKLLNALNQGS